VAKTPLTHNSRNPVTAGVWAEAGVVHKLLTPRGSATPGWERSDDERHWNYWRREALAYETELPNRLGLGAPRFLGSTEREGGEVELRIELVDGRSGEELMADDLELAVTALGRAQGASEVPADPWLSRGYLRAHGDYPVNWALLDDDAAWERPLIRTHFPPGLRDGLVRLHARRETLLGIMEELPRTVCHLDVWHKNLVRRADGDIAFLDWAFTGDGALGEDVGNLILNWLVPHDELVALDARLTAAYVVGLREAGWSGDEPLVRLGVCASAVKYDWLTPYCLERAGADEHLGYGGHELVDADVKFAEHATALALCAAWADEAERLA
jgi:Phosphotransferase enzyme family